MKKKKSGPKRHRIVGKSLTEIQGEIRRTDNSRKKRILVGLRTLQYQKKQEREKAKGGKTSRQKKCRTIRLIDIKQQKTTNTKKPKLNKRKKEREKKEMRASAYENIIYYQKTHEKNAQEIKKSNL